jgi:energy-coupling factor transporter ATP-binding protein EcfA2
MYKLVRLSLQNWYLCTAVDIAFRGSIGLVGATGAGKSSLLDAIQTVMCGASHTRIHLNASAETPSERKILDYCLGYLVPKKDGGEPMRESCETVLALTFAEERADGSVQHLSAGVVMTARDGDSREVVVTRFIAPGFAYSVHDWKTPDGDGFLIDTWDEIARKVKARCTGFREYRANAERYVHDLLAETRRGARQPDIRHFLRSFSNALAFKPISDPTAFMREFILERDDLDVSRVRDRVATWRGFVEDARKVEEKLDKLKSVRGSYDTWGRAVLHRVTARWRQACAAAERTRLEYAAAGAELKEAVEDLGRQKRVQASMERHLTAARDEQSTLKVALGSSGAEDSAARIKAERRAVESELKGLEQKIVGVRQALQMAANIKAIRQQLPGSFVPLIAEAEAALSIMGPGLDWLRDNVAAVGGHCAKLKGFAALPERLAPQIQALEDEISRLRQERNDLEGNVTRLKSGAAPLSPHTQALMRLLAEADIRAEPICDLVEVVEEDWQFAVESLLGPGREALIVNPADVQKAYSLWHANRNSNGLHQCRLVKTTRTGSADLRADRRSLAGAVRSDNRHAAAYLASHLGGWTKAEDEAELERANRAIMRNGKATSGLDYRVHRDTNLILGRKAREGSVRAAQERLDEVRRLLSEKQVLRERLTQAATAATAAASHESDFDALADAYAEILREVREIDIRAKAALTDDQRALVEQIAELDAEIAERKTDTDEQGAVVLEAARIEGLRAGDFEAARRALRAAVVEKRAAARNLATDEVRALQPLVPRGEGVVFPSSINPFLGERLARREKPRAAAAHFKSCEKAAAEELQKYPVEQVVRLASNARTRLTDYCRVVAVEPPYSQDAPAEFEYGWTVLTCERLEKNELRQHLEAAAAAEREVVFTIKEDLLNKLNDKFKNLDRQIRALNGHLRRHRFTDGQVYKFGKKADPGLRKIRKLALAVAANPDDAQTIIEKRHEDPELRDAMADLEIYIDTAGGDGLEDYRRYFSFDLYMLPADKADEDVDDGAEGVRGRMSLSARAGVGSGGEAQAPFYVAMAASMAMSYFPDGHSGPDAPGMGLVLFDEAFNKLDIPNTAALIHFFAGLGLQLMIAAPESARPIFTETLDTVTTVAKSLATRSVYIASDFPKERARRELAAINPNHKGIEGFRADLIEAAE